MKRPFNDWQTPLDEKSVRDFHKKIQSMADQEFGVDQDGDSALEVEIIDRTRYQSNHFQLVPYGHKSEENRKLAFEKTVFNLHVAHGQFKTEDGVRQSRESESRLA